MSLGYLSYGQCFATANEAVSNHYSHEAPYTEVLSGGIYHFRPVYDSASDGWNLSVRSPSAVYSTLEALPTNVVGTCDFNVTQYDYTAAASGFAFSFTFVLSCWIVSKNAGLIMDAIRRW